MVYCGVLVSCSGVLCRLVSVLWCTVVGLLKLLTYLCLFCASLNRIDMYIEESFIFEKKLEAEIN